MPAQPKRTIGRSPAGNRRASADPADKPDRDTPIDSPDRDGECAGCASLQVEVNALRIEVETLTGTMLADLPILAIS